jgi:hypothetical protein
VGTPVVLVLVSKDVVTGIEGVVAAVEFVSKDVVTELDVVSFTDVVLPLPSEVTREVDPDPAVVMEVSVLVVIGGLRMEIGGEGVWENIGTVTVVPAPPGRVVVKVMIGTLVRDEVSVEMGKEEVPVDDPRESEVVVSVLHIFPKALLAVA